MLIGTKLLPLVYQSVSVSGFHVRQCPIIGHFGDLTFHYNSQSGEK